MNNLHPGTTYLIKDFAAVLIDADTPMPTNEQVEIKTELMGTRESNCTLQGKLLSQARQDAKGRKVKV